MLAVTKRFYLKNPKKQIGKKRINKEEILGVHDITSAFIKK